MQVDLSKLPFAFLSNVTDRPFTGTLHLAWVLTELQPDATEPIIEAVEAWARVVNDQFVTTADQASLLQLEAFGQVDRHTMMLVKGQCTNVEPAAWLLLLGLLAQTQHTYGIVRMFQLQLDTGAPVVDATAETWATNAWTKLFTRANRPDCFEAIDELSLGETVDLSMEFEQPLDKAAFDLIQGSLQLFGYLVVTGALQFDFQEHQSSNEQLGRVSQLTPLWFEYSKDGFDAPGESLLLIGNWINGLARRGIDVSLNDVSHGM